MNNVQVSDRDIFATPTDLLVLPSSRNTDVTGWVRASANERDIPLPRRPKQLGETEIVRMADPGFARYICWAASVARNASDASAIRRIATQVAEYAASYSGVRTVAMPLLGAGAGGLSPSVSAQAIAAGFKAGPESEAVLTLHILDSNTARRIAEALGVELNAIVRIGGAARARPHEITDSRVPSCFISYSWDDDDHMAWVHKLATDLREVGIETVLDQWNLQPGGNLPKFMEDAVYNSDFTVLVCTPNFARKANAASGGVGYEKNIVTGAIFGGAPPERFIPVLRGAHADSLPTYLLHKTYVDFSDDSGYRTRLEQLARAIHERPARVPPPVGRNPF
jgi:hypothetical protein